MNWRAIGATLLLLALAGCSDSTVYTNADKSAQTLVSESADLGAATITKDAFLFASPYPARILIPDIEGMNSTAFVVSTLNPSGVLAIDLDSAPFGLSKKFKGVTSPAGTGLPNNLWIQSPARAFMLSSSHIIDFNPTSGVVHAAVALSKSVTLPQSMPLSGPLDYDNDGDVDTAITTVPIAFPGAIAVVGDTLWISTANYLRYATPAVAAPGLLLRYTITANGLAPAAPSFIVTSGYNPTGLTATGSTLLVTNSGVLDIIGGEAKARTPSSIDMVDAATAMITATIPADLSALGFFPPALDGEGRFAYLGSTAFSEVYQFDAVQKIFTRSLLNPILIGPQNQADYLTAIALSSNGERAYVGSFDHSRISILDLTASPIAAFPTTYVVGFSKGVSAENPSGVTTGVSDMAIHPGTNDLYVLTGNPGTLVTITAQAKAKAAVSSISVLQIAPLFLPLMQGKLSMATVTVSLPGGKQLANVHDFFKHPETGQTLTVNWSSDNTKVATVSSKGLVTGVAGGITTIRAQIGSMTASATVAVHLGPGSASAGTSPSQAPPLPIPGESVPPPGKENESGKLVVIKCDDQNLSPFVQGIMGIQVGTGGGAGQDKLPGAVTGPPNGGGAMQGNATDIYSLGAKGQIILAFTNCMIADGPGTDFIVFENAFYAGGNPDAPYSEPAIVGVSMDGVNFTDFPCDLSQAPKFPGCAGTHPVLSNPENGIDPLDPAKAGGDPFDLATITVPSARFVRIVDQGLSPIFGANGTNGFDLDAIAVIHGAVPK